MSAPFTGTCMTVLAPTKRIDLAIIGGGCAGLSLARELAAQQTSRSVMIIEPRTHYQDDRSWCFWAPRQHALSHLVSHRWTTWQFGHQGKNNQQRGSADNPYQYIRSSDFYQDCYDKIAQCPSIDYRLGISVLNVERLPDGWGIETSSDSLFATHIIDTRPPGNEYFSQAMLYQCFLGVEIELNDQLVNDHTNIELMTDMQNINGDFFFTYLLPFSKNRILIEQTIFSAQPVTAENLQQPLNLLIEKRGLNTASILRTEYGILPMGLPTAKNELPRAGIGGGALRPSSGYGFMRIQRWARNCATQFIEQGTITSHADSGFFLSHMDQLFLRVLRIYPQLTPTLFQQLLGQTDTERFIRFMIDQANLLDYLNIVSSLPKAPFIKALFSRSLKSR
jgi:lycopene beta-cyclase